MIRLLVILVLLALLYNLYTGKPVKHLFKGKSTSDHAKDQAYDEWREVDE